MGLLFSYMASADPHDHPHEPLVKNLWFRWKLCAACLFSFYLHSSRILETMGSSNCDFNFNKKKFYSNNYLFQDSPSREKGRLKSNEQNPGTSTKYSSKVKIMQKKKRFKKLFYYFYCFASEKISIQQFLKECDTKLNSFSQYIIQF